MGNNFWTTEIQYTETFLHISLRVNRATTLQKLLDMMELRYLLGNAILSLEN